MRSDNDSETHPASTLNGKFEPDEDSFAITLMEVEMGLDECSERTIKLYISVARRLEAFALAQDPPIHLEEATIKEVLATANAWAKRALEAKSLATRRVYRTAIARYIRAIPHEIETDWLDFEIEDGAKNSVWQAGILKPSDPLTSRQLTRLRKVSSESPYRWMRVAVELALSGLSWEEIGQATKGHFSSLVDPPRITLQERTIEIHDPVTSSVLASAPKRAWPAGQVVRDRGEEASIRNSLAAEGLEVENPRPVFVPQPVSLRTLKSALNEIVTDRRKKERRRQGIRALHNTGALRLISRGVPLSEVAVLYRRKRIPKSWRKLDEARKKARLKAVASRMS